ncbi:cobyric acid synthase [Siminovitchia sp. FSL H7-0308]|uniref:Cobyric acid synthase n=1 Tax=Siminovitchia thermophila TaxID=1245522 RepID=A0ABS2R811_9BACI|nr:cobyric acid synthase [Siminovitchia thermophila]MBM7715795.1 cobyric acid synthase CobQ [Siminovitchia thermophila]ONK23545.1 cobyric acid synthase CobQ [Bacillus sp. VT-16-64]
MRVMILGTASDAGKSFITSALCRLLKNEGWKVAPFKSQNMTNNTFLTKEGDEIGLSQAIQAKAAGIEPSAFMNPILLKPVDGRTEVILCGKKTDSFSYEMGLAAIKESLNELAKRYDAIVLEGAGSPVEVNLREKELVNMRVAKIAEAPALLVADIDRGGVFASIVGTLELLAPEESRRIKGIIINKFRGDVLLFQDGVRWIEEKTGVPVVGVVPFMNNGSMGDLAENVKEHLDWPRIKEIMVRWKKR